MIVYLIGGSNSVLPNGLKVGLEEELNNLYENNFTLYNKSLWGASSLRHINQLMTDIDIIKKSDIIITESNINDTHRFQVSRYNVSLDKIFKEISLYYELLSSFNKKVLVIITNYINTEKTKSLVISNIHRYFIDKYGFSYIDIYQYYHINLSRFADLYYTKDSKWFINNFSNDKNHELGEIMRGVGRSIVKNLSLIKNSKIIYSKPSSYELSILNASNMNSSFVENNVCYSYAWNTYNESLINITNKGVRLYTNNKDKSICYRVLGIQTFCKPKENLKINENMDGFYSSYVIKTDSYEVKKCVVGGGIVKFSRLGVEYEHILVDAYCSQFVDIYDNINDIPLTERSFHEIPSNKAFRNTKNYELFVHSVLLCRHFDDIYVENNILESCSIYQSTHLTTLNLNDKILVDLSLLIDIFNGNWIKISLIGNLFNKLKSEKKNIEDLFNKVKSEKDQLECMCKKVQLNNIYYQKQILSLQEKEIDKNIINYSKKDLKMLCNPYKYFLDSKNILLKIFCIFFIRKKNISINTKQKNNFINFIISIDKLSNKPLKKRLVLFLILLFRLI